MPFQTKVNNQPAPGQAGDFASTNPFASVLSGPGALVAPAGGLIVGNFAWVGPAGQVSQSFVSGWQIGFLGRNEQALITAFLGEATLVVPSGFMVNLFNGGDFWAMFSAGATPGMNVYADPNTGAPVAGNTTPASAAGTATQGATFTVTTTTGASANVITVTAVSAGILATGDIVTSTNVPTGSTIVSQLTVTSGSGAGLLGTYQISNAATAAATGTAATSVSTVLNVTAVSTGAFNIGDSVTGSGTQQTLVSQGGQFSGVGTFAGTTALTITSIAAGSGRLRVGDTVTADGTSLAVTIASQTSGTPGQVGVYVLSAAVTTTGAAHVVGDTNIPGARGRYVTNLAQNVASGTVTVAGTYQLTTFKVRGAYTALADEVAKISTL